MPPLAWAALVTAIFYGVIANATSSTVGLIALGFAGPAVYWLSLKLHPNTNCRHCRGTARHRGWLFNYAHRPCVQCAGTGRHVRWGYRTFFSDGKKAYALEQEARAKAKAALRKRH
jgi:hypothetical protein